MPYVSVIPDGLERIVPSFTAMTCITVLVMVNVWALTPASVFRGIW